MKAKVLVVEDGELERQRLVAALERLGYEVRSAVGGLEALGLIKREPPDIVLLDVVLDGMDGYSVCRWIRLGASTRDIVVIMLTIKDQIKEKVAGLNVGADDYMPKPVDYEELDARIFAALRNRGARLELRDRNVELEAMLVRTEHLAMTDALTGVFNRRRFNDVVEREFASARRYKFPVSLLLLDVDRFKVVNDRDGHAAGDETLRRIAEILSGNIREVDVCARYGGDEFALLLPHTDAEPALVVAERVRTKLAAARAHWAGEAQHVSLSIGISSSMDPALKNPNDLVEAADRALYQAKRTGRDRIVVAAPGSLQHEDPEP